MKKRAKRVLAAASGGGHWEQLMLLREALGPNDVQFATTDPAIARQHAIAAVSTLPDCNQDTPFRAVHCALVAGWLVLRTRPDVIISTGAAPGFFCILWGRLLGARTLWIDSVANAEQLSLCGKLSARVAHECLTQWEHLEHSFSAKFRGSVL